MVMGIQRSLQCCYLAYQKYLLKNNFLISISRSFQLNSAHVSKRILNTVTFKTVFIAAASVHF